MHNFRPVSSTIFSRKFSFIFIISWAKNAQVLSHLLRHFTCYSFVFNFSIMWLYKINKKLLKVHAEMVKTIFFRQNVKFWSFLDAKNKILGPSGPLAHWISYPFFLSLPPSLSLSLSLSLLTLHPKIKWLQDIVFLSFNSFSLIVARKKKINGVRVARPEEIFNMRKGGWSNCKRNRASGVCARCSPQISCAPKALTLWVFTGYSAPLRSKGLVFGELL